MNKQYIKAIEMLCLKLDLDTPQNIDEITSLKVGEQECHITEHPSGRLLMFSNINNLNMDKAQNFLEMNIFSQEEQKPVIGIDKDTGEFILWNQQPLVQAEGDSLYHQLDILSSHYDLLVESNEPSNSPTNDENSLYFDPLALKV
ncbi:CesT family type III secretion system chaperone [Vibrio sagamiensis]|nr:CesT family type III secretion system chaperone [Vibrio sagamiensis]PNQ53883.1 Tir chaperone family protein [Vibrio agarivorans]